MHASVGVCNQKRKAKCSNNSDEYLNSNMLFELHEAFGESGEEEIELTVTNVENVEKDKNGLEFVEGTLESRKKIISKTK